VYLVIDDVKREQGLLSEDEMTFAAKHVLLARAMLAQDFSDGVRLVDSVAANVVGEWVQVCYSSLVQS
jgi:hypothetical protein